jgi:periplasmic protein TonB
MKGLQPTDELDEVVFKERNKEYGAYYIRQSYYKNVVKGMLISVLVLLIGVSIPILANYLNKKFYISNGNDVTVAIGDMVKPPTDEIIKPPPQIPPIKDIEKQLRYEIPEIVTDSNATSSLPIPDEINGRNTYQPPDDSTIQVVGDNKKDNPIDYDRPDNTIYNIAGIGEKPEFPGGEDAMMEFVTKNIVYPKIASQNGIKGVVYVGFVVEKDGSIDQIKILHGIGGGCDEESVRVVQMMPKWTPGKQNGHPVRAEMSLPVRFQIVE